MQDELLELGFVVKAIDAESICSLSDGAIDIDMLLLDVTDSSDIGKMVQFLAQDISVPIVVIGGSDSPGRQADYHSDIVHVAGGADTVVKALELAAVLAKPKQAPSEGKLICGKLMLEDGYGSWGGVDLDLTGTEYRIVSLLASRPGHYFTNRAIHDRLRHKGFAAGSGRKGYSVNVRSAIKRIRKRFRNVDAAFDEIENFTGFGYRWRKPD